MRVEVSGFKVQRFICRVSGSEFRVSGRWFRDSGFDSGFACRVQGTEFRDLGSGFRASGFGCVLRAPGAGSTFLL